MVCVRSRLRPKGSNPLGRRSGCGRFIWAFVWGGVCSRLCAGSHNQGVQSAAAWRNTRRLRAEPPGLAGKDKGRRKVFAAALQQAEELHAAAIHAGFTSRPLPLFYALSQAGRAIAAVRVEGSDWQPSSHGLEAKFDSNNVLTARVSSSGRGAFQTVSAATNSPDLDGDLTLGALLATLPEVSGAVGPHVEEPVALRLEREYESTFGEYAKLVPPHGSLAIYCGPEASLPLGDRQQAAMEILLEPFQRAEGWVIQPGIHYCRGRPAIALTWPLEEAGGRRGYKALEVVATPVGQDFYLRPTLGEGGGEIGLLMTWWAILLLLSSLARYEPARWQAALDVDQRDAAVLLEEVLDLAQERVPELVLEALTDDLLLAQLAGQR